MLFKCCVLIAGGRTLNLGTPDCKHAEKPPCPPPPLCSDMWVCHVVIALKRIAQATALHSQKEIKADHEPE